MDIFVNGAAQQIPDTLSVAELLRRMELVEQRLAVELNREIVPRSRYAAQPLHAGDRIEIVRAVGGG